MTLCILTCVLLCVVVQLWLCGCVCVEGKYSGGVCLIVVAYGGKRGEGIGVQLSAQESEK